MIIDTEAYLDQELSVGQLMELAKCYVQISKQHFCLGISSVPPEKVYDAEIDEFMEALSGIAHQLPPGFGNESYLLVSFLFPELEQLEKRLLALCRICGDIAGGTRDEDHLEQTRAAIRNNASSIEDKLTAIQMEILEKEFLNWDGYE